jgi:catechol 2,3-dioxygenase-like lactoylglutathione lyase family enzyme
MSAPFAIPFSILGIDHVVLRAADPAGLERFYIETLGCTLEKRQGKLTQLRAGRALIDIVPADETGPAGGTSRTGGANLDHFACASIRSTRPRSPGISRPMGRVAGRKPPATARKAKGPRSISPIRKATASS